MISADTKIKPIKGKVVNNLIDEFDKRAKALQTKFQDEDKTKIENGLLYHFRRSNIALNIIKNKELWFADHSYLQKVHDKDELNLGFCRIIKCIANRSSGEDDFWYKFGGNFSKLQDCLSVYVLSLCNGISEKKMWEKYGDNGDGLALGFDFTNAEDANCKELWKKYYLLKVSYENAEFDQHINAFLDLASEYVTKLSDESERKFGEYLASHLILYIPMLKAQDLNWENEYRLVMPGFYDSNGKRHLCNLPIGRFRTVNNQYTQTHFAMPFNGCELKEICLNERDKLKVKYYSNLPSV